MKHSSPSQSASRETLLAMIVDACLNDIRGHKQPRVQEYLAKYPELAEELEAILPALSAIGRGGAASGSHALGRGGGKASQPGPAQVELHSRLGDFVIRREVGRGGMGVVYEARQVSLNRMVALKVLPFAAVLDPRDIQRFRNEAQIAAQLLHPNIVPVYAVGSESGVHYYAMQYIAGQSVAELVRDLARAQGKVIEIPMTASQGDELEEFPVVAEGDSQGGSKAGSKTGSAGSSSPGAASALDTVRTRPGSSTHTSREGFRAIARMGVQAAEALEYAHSMGLVHRDVKPSNLLLDEQGNVWLSDFGLAKLNSTSQLTLSSDLVGTVAYMSPEQTSGGGVVDHRSDIYSLGATLYELASLRRPFESTNRLELLRQVAEGRPRPLRQVNGSVPLDLETIVHKAMAHDRGDRYNSAQEMADDLRRFLESKPIQARRPSLLDRTSKWVQRHRLLVASLAALLVLTTVGSVVAASLVLRQQAATERALASEKAALATAQEESRKASDALTREREALAEAQAKSREAGAALVRERAALEEAQEQTRVTRQAVDDLYSDVVTEWLWEVPHMTPTQQEFLEKLHRYYERFADDSSEDPELLLRAASTIHRMGDLQINLGNFEQALRHFEQAIARLETLHAMQPDSLEIGRTLVKTYMGQSNATGHLARYDESWQAMRRAEARLAAMQAQYPDDYELNSIRLKLDSEAAAFLFEQNEVEQAAERIEQALARESAAVGPTARERAIIVTDLWQLLADIDIRRNELRLALQHLEESERSLTIAAELGAEHWPLRETQQALAQKRSFIWQRLQNYENATRKMKQAMELAQGLRADHPEFAEYTFLEAASGLRLAQLLLYSGEFDAAEQLLGEALAGGNLLLDQYPHVMQYRWNMVDTHRVYAILCMKTNQSQEAIDHFRACCGQFASMLEELPAHQHHRNQMSQYLTDYAMFYVIALDEETRDPERCEQIARRALEYANNNGIAMNALGMAYCEQGKYVEALRLIEFSQPVDDEFEPYFCLYLARSYHGLGAEEEAREQYDLAAEFIANWPHYPDPLLARLQRETAETLGIVDAVDAESNEAAEGAAPEEAGEPEATTAAAD